MLLVAIVLAVAVSAPAGEDAHRTHRPEADRFLTNRGVIGGRAVGGDEDRPYRFRPDGYTVRGERTPGEPAILLEREIVPRGRWRR